ncbi:MAG: glutamate--tRNA ligase, partial [bacterium]
TELGYATSGKEFKAEPEKYKGQVGDIARMFRVLLTGRTISPDLHQVMKVLGRARCVERLTRFK